MKLAGITEDNSYSYLKIKSVCIRVCVSVEANSAQISGNYSIITQTRSIAPITYLFSLLGSIFFTSQNYQWVRVLVFLSVRP